MLCFEEIAYKIKELPRVYWVLPDAYEDVKNKEYGGEPFIDGKAVPYDPKYHSNCEWANERSRRNDRPRNFDRSGNFERRENMQNRDFQSRETPPMPNRDMQNPGPNMGGMPPIRNAPNSMPNMGGGPPNHNMQNSMPNMGVEMTNTEKGKANWSYEMKKNFIDICVEEVQLRGKLRPHLSLSWKKVITSFKQKTGLEWDPKEFENQWDSMRKQFNAWEKLLRQTGIGYNEESHMVTMDKDRWDKYLKVNPDACTFWTKSLQFPEELRILFGGTSATGEMAWTPGTGGLSDDTLSDAHVIGDVSTDPDTPSLGPGLSQTPLETVGEDEEDVDIDGRMNEVRLKRPCPARTRKESRNDVIAVSIDRIMNSIDAKMSDEGPTIPECMESL